MAVEINGRIYYKIALLSAPLDCLLAKAAEELTMQQTPIRSCLYFEGHDGL
jgi:hypothetical protein